MNNENKISLEIQTKLFKLKSIINQIQDISYSTTKILKEYPISTADEKTAILLIRYFEEIIKDLDIKLRNHEQQSGLD